MSAWAAPLRLALSLGLPPEAFWRLSLTEWRALTEAPPAPSLNRATLQDLIARYPDEETPP
ncbi:putative phage protein (TIGR02216 family) [Caulobacter sp. BE264]|uniref:phage tail assembly chaperone n=1 Tax=Caulobacter sp. BE264 TaxID=2817724 RepID=UPI002855A483|nr:phage tail assembly chaperone [Caulobacter sp. BE264]MDR7232391.1 putative phage protein (TIGR02216 family) [Caulobacter sp. BE264]